MINKLCKHTHNSYSQVNKRSLKGINLLLIATLILSANVTPAMAAKSHFSKVRYVENNINKLQIFSPGTEGGKAKAVASSSTTIFDLSMSLYNNPSGDGDPNVDTGSEDQTKYEKIIRYWADAVYEESNGAHRIGKVRIFRMGSQSDKADIIWNKKEHPRANPSGFGTDGQRIIFGDFFPDGNGEGNDKDMLADPTGSGYTLGHEFAHYVYGLYDEYRGRVATLNGIHSPLLGDSPAVPSIMNSQWGASGGNYEWLNHSTPGNYQAKTAQGRTYGASSWDVMTRDRSEDPRDGKRNTLPLRTHYTSLDTSAPKESDTWKNPNTNVTHKWVKVELSGGSAAARDKLDIIWMEDDIEIQLVIDRSGSMFGTSLRNAKQAAKSLVDVVQDGKTALGVIIFGSRERQTQEITAIPDPGAAVKTAIKDVIGNISTSGATAMFDGADLAINNLEKYRTANNTKANRVVFLLSDGGDNSSSATESSVTKKYQDADVPLITFGYGSFSPTGALRRLADNTGGRFVNSPTTLSDIQRAFLTANAAISSSTNIANSSSAISSGEAAVSESLEIDSTLKSFTVIASYIGSPEDITLTLLDSSGTYSGVDFDCNSVGNYTSCTANVDSDTLQAKGVGTWKVEELNNAVIDIDVNLYTIASPTEGRTYDVTVASFSGSVVNYPEPIVVTATVSKGLPITGVNFSAEITAPDDTTSSIIMNDEGKDGDGIPGDGTYSAIIGYESDGVYKIQVKVDNSKLEAHFAEDGFQLGYPSGRADGSAGSVSVPEPISDNFTRTASTQLIVTGSLPDDHSSSMPGTAINSDNTDTIGSINFSGDEDFFQVNGIDLSKDLVIRISGLSLAMDPILTVYMADGTTEVGVGNLNSARSTNGYIYLVIKAADLDQSGRMIAVVKHSSAAASRGTYSISAGAALDSDKEPPPVTNVLIGSKEVLDDLAGLDPIEVNIVTDGVAKNVNLFYRAVSDSGVNFTQVTMQKGYNNLWTINIPGNARGEGDVEVYIETLDYSGSTFTTTKKVVPAYVPQTPTLNEWGLILLVTIAMTVFWKRKSALLELQARILG